jgi:hypothetical protein
VPLGVNFCKREATRNSARAASVLLKSSPKKRIHLNDIPPYIRMSGQFCTNRDFKGYGRPKVEDSALENALKPFPSR